MGKFLNRKKGKGFGRDRSDGPTMHDAVCDDCGQDCKVPFEPSAGKPVYCRDCFQDHDPKASDGGGRDDYRGGGSEMHDAVCDDCGNDCRVPFRPTGGKAIYCSQCFEDRGNSHDGDTRGGGNSGGDNSDILKKLDRIIALLEER